MPRRIQERPPFRGGLPHVELGDTCLAMISYDTAKAERTAVNQCEYVHVIVSGFECFLRATRHLLRKIALATIYPSAPPWLILSWKRQFMRQMLSHRKNPWRYLVLVWAHPCQPTVVEKNFSTTSRGEFDDGSPRRCPVRNGKPPPSGGGFAGAYVSFYWLFSEGSSAGCSSEPSSEPSSEFPSSVPSSSPASSES